jgi:hypothetical protein
LRDAFEHALGGASLAQDQRREFAAPAVDADVRHAVQSVLVRARGEPPLHDLAGLINNPPPRHQPDLAQSHGGVGNVLGWCPRPLVPLRVEIVLRHHAALLQLVKQESAIGRERVVSLVLVQEIAGRTLQLSRLRARLG